MEEAPPKRRVSKVALVPRRQPQRHSGAKRALEIGQMDFRPFVGECLYRTMVLTRSSLTRRKQSVVIVIVLCAVVCLSGLVLQGVSRRELQDETSSETYAYIDTLIQACGSLCQVGAGFFEESRFFQRRVVQFSCTTVFSDDVFVQHGHGLAEPPKDIPPRLLPDFTLGGSVPIKERYFSQMYLNKVAKTAIWSRQLVEDMKNLALVGQLKGNYGADETNHLKSALARATGVQGGRVLVIGSENPWVEATLLAVGASEIITLEYGAIISHHPQIMTMTPLTFKKLYLKHALGQFDSIVTFSSIEHSGLGRYGDALNPWGDVLEIARSYCVCKQGGSLVIGVEYGSDEIQFNAHRVYGHLRWPYLATNWVQVHREDAGRQRVHVFSKP